jgi:malonyl-CoA/methylmalonyl-CoA synthetase
MGAEGIDLAADRSLAGRWTRRWSEGGDRRQLQDIDGSWLTAAELEERTRRRALALLGLGLTAGDRLLISASSSADLLVSYAGALRAGLIVVPVNTGYTRPEVERIVRDAKPAAALLDDEERAGWVREASSGPIEVHAIDAELAADLDGEIDTAGPDSPALLVYTSGTTGKPKGALLTHGNLLAGATAVNLAWQWNEDDVLLLALPLFHLHGLGVGVNGSLCAGAAISLRPKFEADDIARRSRAEATMFFGVPAMYQRLLSGGRLGDLSGLRLLVSGSAPLPAALAEAVAAATGQIPLERYGMTETVMLSSNPYDGERKPGTVGYPLPGVELRLAEGGEVEVRGPNVIAGYYGRPDADAESFTADGWFRTGDLGEIGADRYLRLVGRSKDLIISGGYNVHPREVEEVLEIHPDVSEAAVIGRPSERWGEEVTAFVVVDGETSESELKDHAARHLAAYKVPKRVETVAELPRNALGKLLRKELQ